MRRRLFNFAAAVSIFPWLALTCLWIAGYFYGSTFTVRRVHSDNLGQSTYFAGFGNGQTRLAVHSERILAGMPSTLIQAWRERWAIPRTFDYRLFENGNLDQTSPSWYTVQADRTGFAWQDVEYSLVRHSLDRDRTIILPGWLLTLPWAVFPTLWLVDYLRRSRRLDGGFCPHCGYDLTGNVSGVCPECGTAIVKAGSEH